MLFQKSGNATSPNDNDWYYEYPWLFNNYYDLNHNLIDQIKPHYIILCNILYYVICSILLNMVTLDKKIKTPIYLRNNKIFINIICEHI